MRRVALLCTVPQSVPGQQCSCAVYRKSRCTRFDVARVRRAVRHAEAHLARIIRVSVSGFGLCRSVRFVCARTAHHGDPQGFWHTACKNVGRIPAHHTAACRTAAFHVDILAGERRQLHAWVVQLGQFAGRLFVVLSCESRRHGAVVPACIFHGRSAPVHGLRSRSRHLVHLRVCRVPAEYL